MLAERAGPWNAKPTTRHLPSLWEDVKIRLLTDHKSWTPPQRRMMAKGGRFHGGRLGIAAAFLIALTCGGFAIFRQVEESRKADHAAALVERLLVADTAEVPAIVQELDGYRRWSDPLLREEDGQAAPGSTKKINLALGLLPVDRGKVAELKDDLLLATPSQFSVILSSLQTFSGDVTEPLWNDALDPKQKPQPQFQAACALAQLGPRDQRWNAISSTVVDHLVTLEPSAFVAWRPVLQPARDRLWRPLSAIFRDTKRSETSRNYATDTLAEFAFDQPDQLFDLLADANERQFSAIFGKLSAHKDEAIKRATQEVAKKLPPGANEDQKEVLAKRQANAAVALLRFGTGEPVWPLLKASQDPRVRSYIIHWLSPRNGEPQAILQRLESEPDVTVRRALMLTLGQFTEDQLPVSGRQPLIPKLLTIYERDPDPGLHGAAEWLLRKWGREKDLGAILARLAGDEMHLRKCREAALVCEYAEANVRRRRW